jgi:hypothetical protein
MASGIRWTQEQLDEFQKKKVPGWRESTKTGPKPKAAPANPEKKAKPNKYRNRKIEVDGVTYDSEKEYRRWCELVKRQEAGEISQLLRQVTFELAAGVKFDGEKRAKPALRYTADAVYIENGKLIVEDTKSAHTRTLRPYRDRKHLMVAVLGLQIREV